MPATRQQFNKVGFSPRQASALVQIAAPSLTLATTVSAAAAAATNVVPVASAAGYNVGDTVVLNSGGANTEALSVTAVDLTSGANKLTVSPNLASTHAIGETVNKRSRTVLSARALNQAGFSKNQVPVLQNAAATTKDLIVQARFTRVQAQLILVP